MVMKNLLVASLLLLSCGSLDAQKSNQDQVVRIFVLAGQSNMQGHAVVSMDHPEHYNGGQGNLNWVLANSKKPSYAHLKDGDQWAVRDDVFIRYQTEHQTKVGPLTVGFSGYQDDEHFGPELQFGFAIGDHHDQPVLLIKTAWGGKSLKTDFRPPSAVTKRGGEVGPYYSLMMQQVQTGLDAISDDFPQLKDATPVISGFIWQQGWNDMVDEDARNEYFDNLKDLIHDVRQAWSTPELPVVVGELGNGGKDVDQSLKHFRGQQSRIDAHPAFVGNVMFATTVQHARDAGSSPNKTHLHHWFGNAASYLGVGDSLAKAWIKLANLPRSPRVLILGDSISMGYTPIVKKQMPDAFVVRPMNNHRAGQNCQGTEFGVQKIDSWLSIAGGNWDVIHFNFGLHDLKHVDPDTRRNSNDPNHPEQSPPEKYEIQLRQIVGKLKATGAKLIYATTTPVPEGGVRPFRDVNAPTVYNEIAKRIMDENDIQVNDLFEFANPRLEQIQRPIDVHFKPQGSASLGKEVVRHIKLALGKE